MHSLFSPIELVNTQEIPLGQTQRISISYISESIIVHVTDGETVILKEYLNDDNPDLYARIQVDDTAIQIRHGERPKFLSMLRGYIELHLPRKFFGALHAKTISGRIEGRGSLVLSELTMNNTSGKIMLESVTAGSAVLSTVSGSVEVASLKAEADVHTTSGSIRVGNAEGDGEYKSVSGSVQVNYGAVTGDLGLSSTSGRVRLVVPPLLSFRLEARSISGGISTPFTGSLSGGRHALSGTVGTGEAKQVDIRLNTISGRIELLPGT